MQPDDPQFKHELVVPVDQDVYRVSVIINMDAYR